MPIALKRSYDRPEKSDGYRILVDRIWPRGVSKEDLDVDEWLKEVAPSDGLRKSFHDGESSWSEFRKAYLEELKEHRDDLRRVADLSKEKRVTLVFSAQDEEHNNAVVLKQYLGMLGG